MRIFLDTEFTCFESSKLISIAMVSEDGQEFYRELTDEWELTECTMFVVAWVLPWLANGQVGKTLTAKLDMHLDLIRYVCNVDKLFPKAKEERLALVLKQDNELLEHFGLLAKYKDSTGLRVRQNPYVFEMLGDMKTEDLLGGEAAKPTHQVAREAAAWLNGFEDPVIFVDSEFDKELIQRLLNQPIYCELIPNMAVPSTSFRLHHALDDARNFRLAWLKCIF